MRLLTNPPPSAGTVTLAMLVDLAQDQFIGRVTASTGVPETATITAAARTVLDDITVAAMLSTLGGQPLDATLTALAAYNTNGLLTQTAADTFVGRTITGTAAQINVSNGDGVSGNPTLSLIGPYTPVTFANNGVVYGAAASSLLALAVNATATNKFLTQVSSGAPAWNTIAAGDIQDLAPTWTGNHIWNNTSNLFGGYVRIGGTVAPINTTAGDVTTTRLLVGTDTAFGVAGRFLLGTGTSTDTAAGATTGYGMYHTITPASNSSATFRALTFQNTVNPATGITTNSIVGGFFNNIIRGDTTVTSVFALQFKAVSVDSLSASTATITSATGVNATIYSRPSGSTTATITTGIAYDTSNMVQNAGLTATDVIGFRVATPGAAYTATNTIGLDIVAQTQGTNRYGIRSAIASAATAWNIFASGTAQNHFAGKVGIGAGSTTPTNDLSFGGNVARTLWSERHTTADTAGNPLTLQAGGATAAATNKAGGTAIISSGISTGSGTSGVQILTYNGIAAATSDNVATQAAFHYGDGSMTLGTDNTTKWGAYRFAMPGGTANVTGDWALVSGWGAGASITAVTGNDSRGSVTVTTSVLDTPTLNPVIRLTFKDLTWTTAPFAIANMNDASSGTMGAVSCSTTATTLKITYDGTPTALTAATYVFNYHVIG